MTTDEQAIQQMCTLAREQNFDIEGGTIRRSSSRFCLGVEHGDYNGTELFGVGTDRFIWLAYKGNDSGRVRLADVNWMQDGVIEFEIGKAPAPGKADVAHSWARFPYGADWVLAREGYGLTKGFDGVLLGNIPGGGMSRSASLSLNLILTMLEVNGVTIDDPMRVVDLSQAVENDYIGSPCGNLDQIMILFAREGMGTHYNPADRSINYVPLGENAPDFRLVALDTGTNRPGLEKSTYKIRRAECETLVGLAAATFGISTLADIKDDGLLEKINREYRDTHPELLDRLKYIYSAQKRFNHMLDAWRAGDIASVGRIFREDGRSLRDDYKISGPELESMCDIVRTVPGVYGERMLGGGDKGASGALVAADAVHAVKEAVATAYPRSRPAYADQYAVHALRVVDGIKKIDL